LPTSVSRPTRWIGNGNANDKLQNSQESFVTAPQALQLVAQEVAQKQVVAQVGHAPPQEVGGAGDQGNQMMEMMQLISQMTLSNQQAQQVMLQRQDASTAAAANLAAINAATAATALTKQTPEMSLNTPVLFWAITRASTNGNGKGITPNSFLKELESRQTRHNWTDSELLRYVQSCLRGEADLWWTGTLTTYDDLGPAGPTTNYSAFKLAFRQHYGNGGKTHKLNWADSFHQRSSESTAEYFARSSAELANHMRESETLLFGKEYACADITAPFTNLHMAIKAEIRDNTVTEASLTRQLRAALTASSAAMKTHNMARLRSYRTNLHTLLNSQAIFQGICRCCSLTAMTRQTVRLRGKQWAAIIT
jgi:hypothetical protein